MDMLEVSLYRSECRKRYHVPITETWVKDFVVAAVVFSTVVAQE